MKANIMKKIDTDRINELLGCINEILNKEYKEYYHGKAMAFLDACYMIFNSTPHKDQTMFDKIWECDKKVNKWQQLTK